MNELSEEYVSVGFASFLFIHVGMARHCMAYSVLQLTNDLANGGPGPFPSLESR